MKKFLKISAILGALITLSACGNLKDSDLANNPTTSTSQKKKYQTTSTNDNSYNVLLKNGRYLTSPIAGLTANDNDNNVDERSLESQLMNLSHNQFSTGKYVFQEGQELNQATVTDWLGRYSKSNKQGLNPEKSKKGKAYSPIILDQVLEQDYLTKSGSGYKLGGMSLGLALNSVDYYNKKDGGAEYQAKISRDRQESFGKEAADKIVKRIRKQKGMKNIPILIGLFSKTSKDSLVGGNYFAYGIANANSSKINQWKTVNYRSQILPVVGNEKAINSSDATAFSDFKAAIQDYFPNISGVTANVQYQNDKLSQMNITVTTQFYGYAQVESFTRLVASSAKKYLPTNAPIEIKITSVNDVQALIAKNSADDGYTIHIFGGE
ncbi:CamS family sex pheromone protein [Lactobacillus sp. PV034]|uniref:CamS family sex pheromone protein n=1 Tax=Lactobacillus sp. PV034 TaxID=2594495 RepID=UPI0022402F1E|nr:CamS family sex pheromone protein [Lactobacillus sp. PV034]QNQ80885.1 CamS family sex pheromone protein [Lactobacillus sp. PV034]